MSVPKGLRPTSRFEVIYNASVLNDELTELVLRSFGINSKSSIMRRKYLQAISNPDNVGYVDNLINDYKNDILSSAENIESCLCSAKSIYPVDEESLNHRLNYQREALDSCIFIKGRLHMLARQFHVDLKLFDIPMEKLNKEIKLIKGWTKSDKRIYKSKLYA